MSTLISQFSGACGLRFRNKETGAMRGVRVNNDLFLPPNGAMGWPTDVTFNVVYRLVTFLYPETCKNTFLVKIMPQTAKREKFLIRIQKWNSPNPNLPKGQPKNRPTWLF